MSADTPPLAGRTRAERPARGIGHLEPIIRAPMGASNMGKSAAETRADEEAARDAQTVTIGCAFCPAWSWSGPFGESRAVHAAHRADVHPELVRVKRSRRALGAWSRSAADEQQREDAMVEVERRKRLHGVVLGTEAA